MQKLILLISILFSGFVADPSVTGEWKGVLSEQFDLQVQFQEESTGVTATVSSPIGDTIFKNGKLSGDSLRFTNLTFNGLTVSSIKGKVAGDVIHFVVDFQGQEMKGVLNRVKK